MARLLEPDEMLSRRADEFSQLVEREIPFAARSSDATGDEAKRCFPQLVSSLDRAHVGFLSHVKPTCQEKHTSKELAWLSRYVFVTCETLLTLPLRQRIKWLRSKDGPRGEMSHDKLAKALKTSRQTVISWEKGTVPRRLVDRIVEFSGCPRETWLPGEEDALGEDYFLALLQELQGVIEEQGKEMTRALKALATEVRALEHQLTTEAPRAIETGP